MTSIPLILASASPRRKTLLEPEHPLGVGAVVRLVEDLAPGRAARVGPQDQARPPPASDVQRLVPGQLGNVLGHRPPRLGVGSVTYSLPSGSLGESIGEKPATDRFASCLSGSSFAKCPVHLCPTLSADEPASCQQGCGGAGGQLG